MGDERVIGSSYGNFFRKKISFFIRFARITRFVIASAGIPMPGRDIAQRSDDTDLKRLCGTGGF
jgi:hypothetical protein